MNPTPVARPVGDDYAWETESAPNVSGARMALPIVLYLAWLVFLAWLALSRWFGALL